MTSRRTLSVISLSDEKILKHIRWSERVFCDNDRYRINELCCGATSFKKEALSGVLPISEGDHTGVGIPVAQDGSEGPFSRRKRPGQGHDPNRRARVCVMLCVMVMPCPFCAAMEVPIGTCAMCGAEMRGRGGKLYCSGRCRQRAHRFRVRQRDRVGVGCEDRTHEQQQDAGRFERRGRAGSR